VTGRARKLLLRLGALGACAAAGCSLLFTGVIREKVSAFPHARHVEGERLACRECHAGAAGSELEPRPGVCADCHDEEVLGRFFGPEGARLARAGAQGPEIVFDHAAHAARSECMACHADVAASDALYAGSGMRMDACVACHAEAGPAERDCAACHREIRPDARPATHTRAWLERHGGRADAGGRTADRCDLCHESGSCQACHSTVRPRTHTPAWRDFGHGLAAGIKREQCAVCHTRDQCDGCHAVTAPRDHRGGFTSSDAHCLRCHLPFRRDDRCGVCHLSLPAHPSGAAMPADATHQTAGARECRACHGGGPERMRHPDSGVDCRHCHF